MAAATDLDLALLCVLPSFPADVVRLVAEATLGRCPECFTLYRELTCDDHKTRAAFARAHMCPKCAFPRHIDKYRVCCESWCYRVVHECDTCFRPPCVVCHMERACCSHSPEMLRNNGGDPWTCPLCVRDRDIHNYLEAARVDARKALARKRCARRWQRLVHPAPPLRVVPARACKRARAK